MKNTKKMNSLHIEIARTLINYASNRKVIAYDELCDKVGYPSPRVIEKELEKIDSLTCNEKYAYTCISVIVVNKKTINSANPTPGSGFMEMYENFCGKQTKPWDDIIREQREKVFSQDWSGLLEDIRQEIFRS